MPDQPIPDDVQDVLDRIDAAPRLFRYDTNQLILALNRAIGQDEMGERQAERILMGLPHHGVGIPTDPFASAREMYRFLELNKTAHRKLGVHLEGFHLDAARDLTEDVAERLDPVHGVGLFDIRQLYKKDGSVNRTMPGIQRALRHSRVDTHDVVDFGTNDPTDIFKTATRFVKVCHPTEPLLIRPRLKRRFEYSFAPHYVVFHGRPFPESALALLEADSAYKHSSDGERYDLLLDVLRCVPVRLLSHADGFTHAHVLDESFVREAGRQGLPVTEGLINASYALDAVIEDTLVTDNPEERDYEEDVARYLEAMRRQFIEQIKA